MHARAPKQRGTASRRAVDEGAAMNAMTPSTTLKLADARDQLEAAERALSHAAGLLTQVYGKEVPEAIDSQLNFARRDVTQIKLWVTRTLSA
jgi:hypothetical protein